MTTSEIIQIIGLVIPLLASISGFVIAIIKAVKGKKWKLLEEALKDFITNAETFPNITGTEKKDMVLSWAEEFCNQQGIKFDAVKVGAIIDDFIELTKKVNQREKDKTQTNV